MTKFLLVPGTWLKSCGLGDDDRIFPVTKVTRTFLPGEREATFAEIVWPETGATWTVYVEARGAKFVDHA